MQRQQDQPDSAKVKTLLAKAICSSSVPFRFPGNKHFRRQFCKDLESNFKVPTAKTIRTEISRIASEHVADLKKEWASESDLAYSDLRADQSFYSVHVSYIDKNFERQVKFRHIGRIRFGKRFIRDERSREERFRTARRSAEKSRKKRKARLQSGAEPPKKAPSPVKERRDDVTNNHDDELQNEDDYENDSELTDTRQDGSEENEDDFGESSAGSAHRVEQNDEDSTVDAPSIGKQ
ncbi:unnamed protein product [Caenorhabditis sp. 36 PRJEB53466]|nr:unnamed protein product [Caenorhabditis sp. 36 PRJEB53466]